MPMGSLPYEEYFFLQSGAGITKEVRARLIRDLQRADVPLLHLLGCARWLQESSNSLKSWVDYLFPTLEKASKEARFRVVEEDILRMMRKHDHRDVVLEEDDGIYEKSDILKSFHHRPVSRYSGRHFWPAFCQFG